MDYAAATYYPGLAAYAATPQFIAERRQVTAGADGAPVFEVGFDILVNAVRSVETDLWEAPRRSRAFGVHQGVVDTLLEYLALGGGAVENTHAVLEQVRAIGAVSRLLDADDFGEVAALPVDPAARAAIGRDIAAGYLVLAPAAPVEIDGRAIFGWWRIDPATGETLGMAGDGRGQSMTQKVIQEGIALTLVNAVICGAFSGLSQPGNGWRDFGICMAIATALIPIGIGLYAVASRIARAAVTGFGRWAGAAAVGGAGAAGAAAAGSGAHPTPPPRPATPPSAGAHPPGTPPPTGGRPPGAPSEPPGGLFGGAGQPPHGPTTPAGGSGSGGSGGTRPTIEYPTGTPGRPTRPTPQPERPTPPERPQPTIEYPAGTPERPTPPQPERPQPTIEYPPPSSELAQNTGPLQEPWMVRPGEGQRPASARDARLGEPMQLDPNVSETYMYVVKEDGTITYAPQEHTPAGRETVKHTDLAENGPARVSGELNWNSERGVWEMDNNSGRYSFEPDPAAGQFYNTRTEEHLNAAVELAQNTGTEATIEPAYNSQGNPLHPNLQGGSTR